MSPLGAKHNLPLLVSPKPAPALLAPTPPPPSAPLGSHPYDTVHDAPSAYFFSAPTPDPHEDLDRAASPAYGIPWTRHPTELPAKAGPIPLEALEPTAPGSQEDLRRRTLCQSILNQAPVLADGVFELPHTGDFQHPLVELAKKAIEALQVDQDPEKFADCFDPHAEIIWHRIARGKETRVLNNRDGFLEFARGWLVRRFRE